MCPLIIRRSVSTAYYTSFCYFSANFTSVVNNPKFFSGVERKELIPSVLSCCCEVLSPLKGMQRAAYVALSTDSLLDYTEEVSSWPRLWCNRQERMIQPATLSSASPRRGDVMHGGHWACLYLLQMSPLDGHSTVPTARYWPPRGGWASFLAQASKCLCGFNKRCFK